MNRPPQSSSRRSFLKNTSIAAVATLVNGSDSPAQLAESGQPRAQKARGPDSLTDPVSLVNLLQGTNSTRTFSRGNTLPIAARPFGMAHWTLQSAADTAWMFAPGERRIQGFRCTHQLSPWLSDYGQATFLPFCGEINPNPPERASSYRPEDAILAPHSLRLHLARYDIDAELIPTERCALIKATFGKPGTRGFLFDVPGDSLDIQQDATHRTISFASTSNSGGVPKGFANYYVLRFATPWKSIEVKEIKGRSVGLVHFEGALASLDVRIAPSFISFEQAQRNLNNGKWDDSCLNRPPSAR